MTTARAVYTAVIGGHELPMEQPCAKTSEVPFICFTDDPDLVSDTWDVRIVPPLLDLDPVRSARALKLTGHPDLAAYAETLWVDARVRLTRDPGEILDDWLDDGSESWDVAIPRHSFRVDVVAEFQAVLLLGLDDSARLYEQLTHYASLAPELLEAPAPWTGLLARRHTPDLERAMHEWLLHVLRYSRRDQLSVTHALAKAGVRARLIEIDNESSGIHEWPRRERRSRRPSQFRVADSLQPPVARIGQLQHELEQMTAESLRAIEHREQKIEALELAVARLTDQLELRMDQLARKQNRVRELRATVKRLRTKERANPRGGPR